MKTILTRLITLALMLCLVLSFAGCNLLNTDVEKDSSSESKKDETPLDQKDDPESSEDDSPDINELREDYDLGTCKRLSGAVSVILFYIDDFESQWTNDEIDKFTEKEVEPGLRFLEKEAKKYDVDLTLTIKEVYRSIYYDGDVIVSIKNTGLATINVLKKAAAKTGFDSTESMIEAFRNLYQTDEVICFTIFNKNGTAYAINPKRNDTQKIDEHCIIFSRDLNSNGKDPVGSQSSVIAHEALHLFGAEDFYSSASRKSLAKRYYPGDIMLSANYYISTNSIGKATAFYIGWVDEVPSVLYDEQW